MSPLWKRAARSTLRAGMRCHLRTRSRPLTMSAADSLMIVSPHPDDDVLGCGGLIQTALAQQAAVRIVYLTDGGASHPGHPVLDPTRLARQRKAEAAAATNHLGLRADNLVFLGGTDGTLDHLPPSEGDRLTAGIAAEIDRFAAQIIAAPCRTDGSSEHDAAFGLLTAALARNLSRPRVLEFPVWAWWNPLRLPRAVGGRQIWRLALGHQGEIKRQALAEHR